MNSTAIAGAIRGIGAERVRFLGVITGGHFFIHWFQQLFPVVIPSIKAGLGLDDVQVGALNSARQFAQGSCDFPVGMLSDALVRHRGLILASALVSMGAGYFLMGSAPVLFWALVGAGLVGLGTSLWHPTAAASLSNKFPERRATALSVHGIGATVSDTLTPLGVGFLLVMLPWQTVLRLQLVPGLILGYIVWRALVVFFADAPARRWRAAEFRDVYALGKNPAFLGVCAATALLQMGRLSVITFLPIYIQEHLGYSPFGVGVYIALLHAMGSVSQPVLGHLSDRYGRKAVLMPSFIAMGILCLLLAVAAPGLQLGLVVSAIGLFFYTLINITNAATLDVAGDHIQGSSFGLTSLVNQVVVFPTPLIAGYLVERQGILSAFWLAGIFLLLGAVVLIPLKLYKGTHKSEK
ncbi:MAG TPA: MFS transporter [Verrucomicrobiae bacterium]|nr:MFS transporter [Verrucomicrobiae bacterium]